MSLEICELCKQECTPWAHFNGHVCQDCFYSRKMVFEKANEEILELPQWIDVKNKLPQQDGMYLIAVKSKSGRPYALIRKYIVGHGFVTRLKPFYWLPVPLFPEIE